jgi:hypothetical protein
MLASADMRDPTLVLLALVLGSCSGTTIQFARTNQPPHALQPRAPETVEVFHAGPPQRAYVEIGVFEGQQMSEYSFDTRADIARDLQAAAAQTGCDALVFVGTNDSISGGGEYSVNTRKGYRAVCIVYTAPAAPVATTAPPTASAAPAPPAAAPTAAPPPTPAAPAAPPA